MIVFSRRGACPALSAPMATGDGLLVRLNPVARGLTPNGLTGLAQSARRHGNGVMEITARGSLQVRGFSPETASLFAAEVDALGIAVHSGVPVETGPLAGLDPEEIADPLPIAEKLRASIAAAGLSGRLGPKVSVVIDGGGRFGMGSVLADIRLAATRSGAGIVWTLSVGGDGKTAKLLGAAETDAACEAALAVLDTAASLGREARARDLTAQQLQPALWNLAIQASPSHADVGPRQESEPQGDCTPLGIFDLVDGRSALAVALPFGHVDGDRLIDLTVQTNMLGANEIRFAPQRTLLLLCDSHSAAGALQDEAGKLGFVTDPADARLAIAACPGAPDCSSGHITARETAREIAVAYGNLFDGSLSLHISGCAKGCARHAPATITLVGGEKGAGFVAEGTARDNPAAYTAPDGAAQGFGRLATLLRAEQRPGETMATCLSRIGAARAAEAFRQG